MTAFSERDRRAIRLGVVALVLIGFAYFVLFPFVDSWSAVRARAASARVRLVDLETRVRQLTTQRRRLEPAYGESVRRPLLTVEETALRAPAAIQNALQRAGIGVSRVRPQAARSVRELPGVSMVPVQVEGSANMRQIAGAMSQVRRADLLMVVDRLALNRAANKPDVVSFTLNVDALALEASE